MPGLAWEHYDAQRAEGNHALGTKLSYYPKVRDER